MPRLARHKGTGAFLNDFQRTERPEGAALANAVRLGLNPADYEEVVLSLADYDAAEQAFFAAARASAAAQAAAEAAVVASARGKFSALLSGFTPAERAVLLQRLFGA